jgi:ribosome assembly protein YihI (activator of Der GTPase)
LKKVHDEEELYVVEYQVVQTYQFQVRTKKKIDDLYDYYLDEGDENNFQGLIDRVKEGRALPKGEPEYVDESLEVLQLSKKSHTIIGSRRY